MNYASPCAQDEKGPCKLNNTNNKLNPISNRSDSVHNAVASILSLLVPSLVKHKVLENMPIALVPSSLDF